MANKSTEFPLKIISGIVSIVTFLADLITVGLFIRSVFYKEVTLTSAVTQVAVIIVVFAFATLLWFYSKQESQMPEFIFSAFSWIYITFSAAIFAIISQRFLMDKAYTFGEYIGYILLIFFIGGLGYFIYETSDKAVAYFSIPYMLVALEQILLWIFIIFSQAKLEFNWMTVGNLFLFVIAGLIVLFFIRSEESAGQIPLVVVLSLIAVIGYIILGFTISPLWYIRALWIGVPVLIGGVVLYISTQ